MAPKAPKSKKTGAGNTVKSGNLAKSQAQKQAKVREDRDSEVKALRTLKKIKGFDKDQIHKIEVDGKTLWTAIVDFYKAGNKRMSPGVVLQFRTKYQSKSGGFTVKPEADSQKTARLVKILAFSIVQDTSLQDRPGLYSYLSLCTVFTEADFCATLNSITSCNIFAGTQDLRHCMAVINVLHARGWLTKFKAVFEKVKPFMISCVVQSLTQQLSKMEAKDWYLENREQLGWALPLEKVNKIYDEDEATRASADMKFQIMTELVNGGCPLAELMFGNEISAQTLSVFKAKVEKEMAALIADFTNSKIESTQATCFQIAEEYADRLGDSHENWELKVKHGVMTLSMQVKDTFRHVELSIQNVIKVKCTGLKQGVPALLPQQWLQTDDAEPAQCPIDQKYLAGAIKANKHFNDLLGCSGKDEGLQILAWAQLRMKAFEDKDRTWQIQSEVLSQLCYERGPDVLQSKCLAILPKDGQHVSLSDFKAKLDQIEDSPIYKFVPEDKRGPIISAMGLVAKMRKGKLVRDEYKALAGLEKTVGESLQWFAKRVERNSGVLTTTEYFGMPALNKMVEYVDSNPTAEDLGDVIAEALLFKFLLEADVVESLEAKGKGHMVVCANSAPERPRGGKRSRKAASNEKTTMELAMDAANNLFC